MALPRSIGTAVFAGALLALAVPVFWLSLRDPSPVADPVLDAEGHAKLAAMSRIEAQSLGAPALPPVRTPPRERRRSSAAAVERNANPPEPPPGYAFVPAPTQMAKAPLAAAPADLFAAQPPATPNADLAWLDAADAVHALAYQAEVAGRDWSFGWLRLAEGASAAELAPRLDALGGEVLGAAGNLVRARLPGNLASLRIIDALPAVGGIGARPSEDKIETLHEALRRSPAAPRIPVLITLMADDPDGRWRQALEAAGATVGAFHPDVRAYPANVHEQDLASIAALDAVLAIDPVRVGRGVLDRAAMAMGADALRTYDTGAELFTGMGGAAIPIGVMDSGLNIDHGDIGNSSRRSICGVNLLALPFTDLQEDDADLWRDAGDHGTHVTGILLGNGATDPRFAGMAPLVRHIRFAKVLHHETGAGSAASFMRAMDWLARATSCADADDPDAPVKPLIVNMSLAASGRHFRGKEVDQRKLDATVWNHRQLYVVAQDNTGPQGFSNFAAAKNSLAVGAATNTGTLAAFSSFGPTADGRLAPQVVATGVDILSAKGDASNNEYAANSGTSMASPAAAGVAALLMDAVPKYRQQPALVRAQLMASAIKPDAWLDSAQFPASNTAGPGALQHRYGLGKVSARTSVLQRDQADGWTSGSAIVELEAGQYAYQDIVVPSGASRLDVAMTWDEPAADAIGTTVLNDLDLHLDAGADCGSGACGEHASTSRIDNVEWLVVRDPAPGTYRVKVIGKRIYTAAPRAAVAWTVIRGDSTPTLSVRADRATLTGDGAQPLTLTIATSGYVAAGVRVSITCRTADGAGDCDAPVENLRVQREDGVSVADLNAFRIQGTTDVHRSNLATANYAAFPLPLGELAAGEERQVRLAVEYRASDAARLHVKVDAWNAIGASTSIEMGPSGGAADDAAPPINHVFANAETLRGEEGEKTTDLLLARSEPGEALLREPVSFQDPTSERPGASVWYVWTAPSDGVYQFSAVRDFVPSVRESGVRVHVFRGEGIVDARRLVGGTWAADALFEAGERYRIRVSAANTLAPVKLRWHAAARPANDDFAAAEALPGAAGSFQGTTWGATLERGEWLGPGAASVWHRWTAPNDGVWEFESDEAALAVFRGETVSALRLVSGKPGGLLRLPVGAGLEYRIAALAGDARLGAGATSYELRWRGTDDRFPNDPNDLFANAKEMGESASGSYDIHADIDGTVEPGEPAETGARTRWWSWRAPSDGRVTWRLDPLGFGFQVAAFAGTALGDLELLAVGDGDRIGTLNEFAFDAESGERYWIGTGLHPDSALGDDIATGKLEWAPTPANDGLGLATVIAAASGSASGDNRWATVDGNESSRHGGSSVWWNFDAPTTGPYRFVVTGANQTVAVYRRTGDGAAGLALVEAGGNAVTFDAIAGVRYAVRVGSLGRGGEFELSWWQESADSHSEGHGHFVALFPAAATEGDRVGDEELVEGFVRVVNRSSEAGTVRIVAHDDAGTAGLETVTLSLAANQRRHFNSGDLENGNADKGLAGAIGDGEGDWRLSLTTDLDIDVFAYARTKPGGFLTSLHDVAPCTANRCRIAVFNPGSNVRQRSLLRLVNPGDEAAAVTIAGTDDAGESPGSTVRLDLAPGTATTLNSQDLEGGARQGLRGALGDGVGKWELVVEADPAIQVMSLLKSPTGHLTNLSSTRGQ